MSLLTLPRFDPAAAGALRPTLRAARLAPSPGERAIAATTLQHGLRRGRLTPAGVTAALARGDAGVARLLHQHAALPARPQVSAAALRLRDYATPPPPHLRRPLATLVRVLAKAGDLTQADCRGIASAEATFGEVLRRINHGWNRRCARVAAPVHALLPGEARPSSGFQVMPGPLLAALRPGCFDEPLDGSGERTAECIPDVHVCAQGMMVVAAPVPWTDADGQAAFRAAWNDVVDAVASPVMARAEDALEMVAGYADEQLRDLALSCRWKADVPGLRERELVPLGDELGLNLEDAEQREALFQCLRFYRAEGTRAPWKVRGAQMRQWERAGTDTALRRTVHTLRALARIARAAPRLEEKTVEHHYSDEGVLPLVVLPTGTGLDDYFHYNIEQYWQSSGNAEVTATRTAGNDATLARLLDRWITDTAIAAAASALIEPAPAPTPSSAAEDDAQDDDDDR